jgi:adenine-specific DNA-methyltransferase
MTPINFWEHEFAGHTDAAKNEIKSLFGYAAFDNPKPTQLIKRVVEVMAGSVEAPIVLDYFAGSGTTGHAVISLNREDGGRPSSSSSRWATTSTRCSCRGSRK